MSRVFSMRDHGGQGCAQANGAGAGSRTRIGTEAPLIFRIVEAVQIRWPKKPDVEIRRLAGVKERWAKEIISKRANISGEHLANMLRSEDGLLVLDAIMGKARPVWWKLFKRRQKRANLREQIKQLELQLESNDAADTE